MHSALVRTQDMVFCRLLGALRTADNTSRAISDTGQLGSTETNMLSPNVCTDTMEVAQNVISVYIPHTIRLMGTGILGLPRVLDGYTSEHWSIRTANETRQFVRLCPELHSLPY